MSERYKVVEGSESEMNVTYQNGWAVPAGWKLVPEKPTYELVSEVGGVRMDEESFLHEYADHEKIGEICRAVVKYSPPPPKAPDYNPGPLDVSVIGMPEFDALLDHIYEEGTSSEGAVHLANKLVRVAIQSHMRDVQRRHQDHGAVPRMCSAWRMGGGKTMTTTKPEAKRRDTRRTRPRTMVAYIVYPPSFQPGGECKWYRNRQRAVRAALQLGVGAEIYRDIRTVLNRCEQCRIEPLWVV